MGVFVSETNEFFIGILKINAKKSQPFDWDSIFK
jgi:hypothetical protein